MSYENYGHPQQFPEADLEFPPIPHQKKSIALRMILGVWVVCLAFLIAALAISSSNWEITTLFLAIVFYGGPIGCIASAITAIVEMFTKKKYLHSWATLGLCIPPFAILSLFIV